MLIFGAYGKPKGGLVTLKLKRTLKFNAEDKVMLFVYKVKDLLTLSHNPNPNELPIADENILLQLCGKPHDESNEASASASGPEGADAPLKPAMLIWSCCSPKVVDKARVTWIVLRAETDGVDWPISFVRMTITFMVPLEFIGTTVIF